MFLFTLLSRVRVFINSSGSLDAEWQDIGLKASRYRRVPSRTPTALRSRGPKTLRQYIHRGVIDPAKELELWEIGAIVTVTWLCVLLWKCLCVGGHRGKAEKFKSS